MLALRFEAFGNPAAVLHAREIERPSLRDGEVLVEIAAASLNPSDVKNVQGAMHGTILPRTPGRDFAGTVVEGPRELVGRQVWGAGGDIGFTRDGSHARFIAVPAGGVALRPHTLSSAQAAAAGVNFVTAWMGLEAIGLGAGETIAIHGSRGGVGMAVVQLARWRGATTIGVERAMPAGDGASAALAADHVAAGDEGLVTHIASLTEGRGVDCVYDTVGAPLFAQTRELLANGGRWAIIASQGPREAPFDIIAFYRKELRLFGIDSRKLDTVACAGILERLRPGFESGALLPPHVRSEIPLAQGVAAFEAVAAGEARGKLVLVPS